MSEFGMQMPGGRAGRGTSVDVYTGLMLVAVLSLLGAVLFMVLHALPAVGPDGAMFELQEQGRVRVADSAG